MRSLDAGTCVISANLFESGMRNGRLLLLGAS